MYKNVQTNPEKFRNLTQHSCCSMLALEFFLKAIKGNRYRFVPKGLAIQTPSIADATPLRNSNQEENQVDPTQFIITNHVRCSTKYLGAPSECQAH